MKAYGPSLAMVDDWKQPIAQLGLTKTTHEYVVYQLLGTAIGWSMWNNFLPEKWANPKLLLTRAVRLLKAATIRPAHARPPHPTRSMAVQQILRCYPPQAKFYCLKLVTRSYEVANSGRYWRVDVIGSAGSYSGLALHSVLSDFACFPGSTKLGAIASPPEMLRLATGERSVIAFRIGYVSGNHPP